MKKSGFTLVELIAVIVILSLLMVLVVPSVTKSSSASKQATYDTKMESVKTAAILYAQDNRQTMMNDAKNNQNNCFIEDKDDIDYRVCNIKIKVLVPKYLVADREGDDALSKGYMEDPRDKNRSLDDDLIKISINPNNRKITAEPVTSE